MRILEAHLEAALNAGSEPYMQLQYCVDGSFTWLDAPNPLSYYKLGGLDLVVRSFGTALFGAYAIRLKRGAYYDQTPHYETSSFYYIQHKFITGKQQVEIIGTIFPTGNNKYSVDGHQTYAQIIDAICAEYGYTATYEDPGAAFWDNIFYPAGRTLVLQSPHHFFTLLRQKQFIYAQDDNDNEIYFRQWLDDSLVGTVFHPSLATLATFDWKQQYSLQYRTLTWRDEANTVHFYPRIDWFPNFPYYNLGYLESTASTPTSYQSWHKNEDKFTFHLKYQDGDILHCSSGTYQVQVFEVFDRTHAPRLHLQFVALPKFTTTEGGPLPSTIEAAGPYTPLNVSNFDGILDSSDNNLQAAMETIDDHVHTLLYAPIDHSASHEYLGSDEIGIKDLFLARVYPFIKTFDNIDGFTASHTGSGAFTPAWPVGILTTGATNPSRACIYGNAIIYVYNNVSTYYTRFKIRIHTVSANIESNSLFWFGLFTSPTGPTATGKHIAFKILNGDIFASCGDGTNGNLQDTNSNFTQYASYHMEFVQIGTNIYFYLNDVLKVTFSTYSPNSFNSYPGLYALTSEAVDKSINCYPLMISQGGSS